MSNQVDTLYTLLKTVPHLVPHASENDSIREIVCIIVESVAQQGKVFLIQFIVLLSANIYYS
jgi:hypothetical protein